MKKISHPPSFNFQAVITLFAIHCSMTIIFLPMSLLGATYPSIVTEDNLRQAVLEQGSDFTADDLQAMDLNDDGHLDAADLIIYVQDNNLPQAVTFTSLESKINEGDSTLSIEVEYTKDYSGSLHYVVSGTTTSGEDFTPLSGTLPVDNRLEQITIQLTDDFNLEDAETIILTLIPDAGYNIGQSQQHIVYIEDNDATWRGNLQVNNMLLGFNVTLTKSGSIYQATVQSDGSNGLPSGTWPAHATISADSFSMTIGPVNQTAEDTLLATDLSRTITLTAQSSNTSHILDLTGLIQGAMFEEIVADEQQQFNRQDSKAISGSFTLSKDPCLVPVMPSTLVSLY
ncbi:MAG: hypothetical protein ABIJ50_11785 [Pseudomonadota bacterium]